MAYANAHYYATRDPLGADGDFITAPEISQMFGELIGLWCADLWMRAGQPDAAWVELGPGRGTLASDALRSMRRFGLDPAVHLVETSPVLRDQQAARVPAAVFHDDVSSLPADRPLIIVANEFFDALPIRQLVRSREGWRERVVTMDGGRFVPAIGQQPMDAAVPSLLRMQPPGTILESCPAGSAIMADLAGTLARQGGALLVIDYGYPATAPGDTLQAVKGHNHVDPFADLGEVDLTAHVDFGALAAVARGVGLRVSGPVGQGPFLRALGLDQRANALMAGQPDRRDAIASQRDRLAEDEQMGQLFKVMAAAAPGWPVPEGFAG
ncbi:class I SAM-dependent methyltransferase [Sphingomonas lacunae]|uniref:Class I SAM-dependent methyltransferase n=2 Tax=Sphingomonas lacunae TaxID=2698828 RepID=A0A6M4AZV3_9SPHN|nr:class I SAM-dependent methyltransferase [Sphingomonas lacunae]